MKWLAFPLFAILGLSKINDDSRQNERFLACK